MSRIHRLILLMALIAVAACSGEEPAKPVSEPGEKLYDVRGVILSRDETSNTVHVDHEEIPGFMAAMKMDYSVRGAKVASLPADNTRFQAKLHVTERAYWLTDVRQIQ
jgi:protein SCO1/2